MAAGPTSPTTTSASSTPIKINIDATVQSKPSDSSLVGQQSLKSQRTYQVGVVYKDIYGRETPVFTSGKGSFTVPKTLSDKRNSLKKRRMNTITLVWIDGMMPKMIIFG